eukprot:scaffold776_cov347-Pavlova_lutheri.AAC.115
MDRDASGASGPWRIAYVASRPLRHVPFWGHLVSVPRGSLGVRRDQIIRRRPRTTPRPGARSARYGEPQNNDPLPRRCVPNPQKDRQERRIRVEGEN